MPFGRSGAESQCSLPKCRFHYNLTNRTIEHFRVFTPLSQELGVSVWSLKRCYDFTMSIGQGAFSIRASAL